jgi:hypothetical protein
MPNEYGLDTLRLPNGTRALSDEKKKFQELTANVLNCDIPRTHIPAEEILDGTHEVKAAIWINGHCGKADRCSIDAPELFPDYQFANTGDALGDPEFVFVIEKP